MRIIDDQLIEAILRGIKCNDNILIEINTSAKKKRCYLDFFPNKYIIRKLAEANTKFCISSDSHWLVDVGQQFEVAM